MAHPIVHIEIPVSDFDTGPGFYSELFGWQTHPMPEMNYTTFETGDGPGGGFARADGQMSSPGEVLIHVLTDDVSATLDQLQTIAAAYPDREAFLAALALDPPQATSDFGGSGDADDDALTLSTAHSAKGREWDAVFVIWAVDGWFPLSRAVDDEVVEQLGHAVT